MRNRTQVDAELLAQAPQLKAVGRLGVGLDNIDLAACKTRGIAVYPATGANDAAVAEYVVGAMLTLLRGVFAATDAVLAGEWPRTRLMAAGGRRQGARPHRLRRHRAQDCRWRAALGMEICAHDPHVPVGDQPWGKVSSLSLDALLDGKRRCLAARAAHRGNPQRHRPRSHCPHEARRHSDQCRTRRRARRGGRGGRFAAGALGGAALDVFETEPLTKERAQVFAGCPNLILTPHIAGVTVESNARVSPLVAEKIRDHLAGAR